MSKKEEVKVEDAKTGKRIDEKTIELKEELKVCETNLKNNKARRDGGFINVGKQKHYLLPIDEEIRRIERDVQMAEIEINELVPMTPYWRFEVNEQWREMNKEKRREALEGEIRKLDMVKKQKIDVVDQISKLKVRIEEIKRGLGNKK